MSVNKKKRKRMTDDERDVERGIFPERNEEEKAESHGFDRVYSFRKPKQEKK